MRITKLNVNLLSVYLIIHFMKSHQILNSVIDIVKSITYSILPSHNVKANHVQADKA